MKDSGELVGEPCTIVHALIHTPTVGAWEGAYIELSSLVVVLLLTTFSSRRQRLCKELRV